MSDEIVTSAEFGQAYLVKVSYNTDAEGKWVGDWTDEHPYTLHGPFATSDEAEAWIDAYPEDTDVHDIDWLTMNLAQPKKGTP